jgi:hypothetical protein
MAHWIQYLSTNPRKYVGATSRYANSMIIYYTEDKKTTFEIYKKQNKGISGKEQWLEITKPYEYRPDMVADEIYGAPHLWWSIMEFNGMKDILEFKAGVNIRIPGDVLA